MNYVLIYLPETNDELLFLSTRTRYNLKFRSCPFLVLDNRHEDNEAITSKQV